MNQNSTSAFLIFEVPALLHDLRAQELTRQEAATDFVTFPHL